MAHNRHIRTRPKSGLDEVADLFHNRLGPGEFSKPAAGEATGSTAVARSYFLRAIAVQTPEVLHDLEKEVLPVYLELVADEAKTSPEQGLGWLNPHAILWLSQSEGKSNDTKEHNEWLASPQFLANAAEFGLIIRQQPDIWRRHRGLNALRRSIVNWAGRYSILTEWIVSEALQTLSHAAREMSVPEEFRLPFGEWWGYDGFGEYGLGFREEQVFHFGDDPETAPILETSVGPGGRSLTIKLPPWDPRLVLWDVYEISALQRIRAAIRVYRFGMEALMEADGYVRTPRKTNVEHFRIFIAWQVQHKTWAQIEEEFAMSPRTAREAAQSVSRACGLKMRTGRAGRPRKQRA